MVGDRTGVELHRRQHGARHDRALRQARRLQGAALGEVSGVRAAGPNLRELGGVLDEVDQSPAQRGRQVRHGRDVDQRYVERDPAESNLVRLRRPRFHDPVEQGVVAGLTRIDPADRAGDGIGNLIQCGPLGPFVRGRPGRHPVGVDERIGAIQCVEGADQTLESLTVG